MDQKVLVDALGAHLDALEAFVRWIVVFAVAAAWAGIRREREIEALGVKFDRRSAFFAVAALYLIANVAVLILFLRVGDLLRLLDAEHLVSGISVIATHHWVLNPFSFFGDSVVARSHAGEGLGLLIATWWLCNTSLSMLMDDKRNKAGVVLVALFLVVGLGSMLAIQRAQFVALEALSFSAPKVYEAVAATGLERTVGNFIGIGVGGLIFMSANVIQRRWISAKKELRPGV